MSKQKLKRFELMVIDNITTNKTDYQEYNITRSKPPQPQPKLTPIDNKEPYKRTDTQTMLKYSNHIPMDLTWRPKEILRTNPHEIPEPPPLIKPDESARLHAQRTRPRLVVSPAVALDDVLEPASRDVVVRDTYTTTNRRETVEPCMGSRVNAVVMGYAPAGVMDNLPKYKPPAVPAQWRMESVDWDRRQVRGHCDATKEFWRRRATKTP